MIYTVIRNERITFPITYPPPPICKQTAQQNKKEEEKKKKINYQYIDNSGKTFAKTLLVWGLFINFKRPTFFKLFHLFILRGARSRTRKYESNKTAIFQTRGRYKYLRAIPYIGRTFVQIAAWLNVTRPPRTCRVGCNHIHDVISTGSLYTHKYYAHSYVSSRKNQRFVK